MSDFGEYTCFICSKKYQGPYNNRHNALKKHGKKVHGEHSGFVCESLKCHFNPIPGGLWNYVVRRGGHYGPHGF